MQGRGRVHPLTIPKTMASAGASHISMDLGLSGPVYTISTACSSANHAIGQAFRLVRHGSESLSPGAPRQSLRSACSKAWEAMRVISPDTCRPFSKDRRGMILGEGGAMMTLEPFDAAKARGAKIYAEICGLGMTSDAHHLTQPTVEGPARAMRAALREASLAPETVGYINAHGTGTLGNDPVESRAIREVFGAHAISWAQLHQVNARPRARRGRRPEPLQPSSLCITVFCRLLQTISVAIRSATWITFPISPASRRWKPRSLIHSHSGG